MSTQTQVRVKICGVTNAADARAVADAGADFVGLNLVGGPRRIFADAADRILDVLDPKCQPVILVESTDGDLPAEAASLIRNHSVRYLQVYGTLDPEHFAVLAAEGFQCLAVLRITPGTLEQRWRRLQSVMPAGACAGVLLDPYHPTQQGGSGRRLDWDEVRRAREAGVIGSQPPMILAGGLTPDNVADAVALTCPWAVDVSSGVESRLTVKDAHKLEAFVRAVHNAGTGGGTESADG